MIEEIVSEGRLLAIILPNDNSTGKGITFFTPPHFSQQLACMNHPRGYKIATHTHREIERQVYYTQEVLFIRRGQVKVRFFNQERIEVANRDLGAGDVIMLISGGHGFEMLEETEMIEVKQGPYMGDQDKIRYDSENR